MSSSSPRRPDQAQLAGLYDAYYALVRHVVREAGVREADVRDVIHEVFIVCFLKVRSGHLDLSRGIGGWLKVTACRTAWDHLKRKAHRAELLARDASVEEHDLPARDSSPEDQIVTKIDTEKHVRACVEALTEEQRFLLTMSDVLDLPMSEIAEFLAIPVQTAYARHNKAKQAFERQWEERRASGIPAVAPFLLWDAESLLASRRAVPPPPPGEQAAVWARLTGSLGWAAATAAAGATAAAAASGLAVTGKQIAAGVVASALLGAGLFATASALIDRREPDPPSALVAAARDDERALGAPSAVAPPPSAVPPTSAATPPSATPSTAPSVARPSDGPNKTEENERVLLALARRQIEQGDLTGAQETLRKIKLPRNAAERDDLMRTLRAHQNGGR
jgi:RNA polymerase sigma factor (sigma-70 family)